MRGKGAMRPDVFIIIDRDIRRLFSMPSGCFEYICGYEIVPHRIEWIPQWVCRIVQRA
jgi:hypothetical protein